MTDAKPPSAATLKKYGMSKADWVYLWEFQGSICPICKKVPPTGNTHIDHYHQKGFKKMKPEERRMWVRGIVCAYCNFRILTKGITLEKAQNMVKYLSDFEERKR